MLREKPDAFCLRHHVAVGYLNLNDSPVAGERVQYEVHSSTFLH